MNGKSVNFLLTIVITTFAIPAHAYVDPGTGSMAVQMIIGGLVAAAFVIKTYYYQLKAKIRNIFGRGDTENATLQQASDEAANADK
jgi:hypothetical protein